MVFGGIIGADISRYNQRPGTDAYQDQLNDKIMAANRLIRADNLAANVRHVYFTTKVHHWSSGRCNHHYYLLTDGLHPGRVGLEHWVTLIYGHHRDATA